MADYNVVTKEKYQKMKAELHSPADDTKVMKKYGFSRSTVRKVRNTKDWDAYCEITFRYHGHPKRSGKVMDQQVNYANSELLQPKVVMPYMAEEQMIIGRQDSNKKESLQAILLIVILVALVAYIAILPFLTGAWSLK